MSRASLFTHLLLALVARVLVWVFQDARMAAAVADYRPATVSDQKLTKESGLLERIELVENEDVVAGLAAARAEGAAPDWQTTVAFAAETAIDPEQRRDRARRKRERKGVDLLAVNLVDDERVETTG